MTRHAKRTYADTSFLMSCFIDDANSSEARATLQSLSAPLMISPLVKLEFRTALWQRVGRKDLTKQESRRVLAMFLKRTEEGLLLVPEFVEADVWRKAEELSDSHVGFLHLRSLDVLHVAMAMIGGAKRFFTFDGRQKRLAEAEELEVSP